MCWEHACASVALTSIYFSSYDPLNPLHSCVCEHAYASAAFNIPIFCGMVSQTYASCICKHQSSHLLMLAQAQRTDDISHLQPGMHAGKGYCSHLLLGRGCFSGYQLWQPACLFVHVFLSSLLVFLSSMLVFLSMFNIGTL